MSTTPGDSPSAQPVEFFDVVDSSDVYDTYWTYGLFSSLLAARQAAIEFLGEWFGDDSEEYRTSVLQVRQASQAEFEAGLEYEQDRFLLLRPRVVQA